MPGLGGAHAGGMEQVHVPLLALVNDCWTAIGLFWLAAAVFFAVRLDASPRERLLHFLRTLLPEPSLFVAVLALVAVTVLMPRAFWRELVFWQPWLPLTGAAPARFWENARRGLAAALAGREGGGDAVRAAARV